MSNRKFNLFFFMGLSLWTVGGGMQISLDAPAYSKKITALRTPAQTQSLILADIDSMLSVNTYRDADPVTWGHETCHGIASRIRQIEGQGTNGFYCLSGNYIVLREPKFTLKALAALIPKEQRGVIYELYLVQQQQYWNDQPAYILDEAYAYQNGTLVGLELEVETGRIEATFVRSLEAATYSLFLMTACPAYDLKCAVGVLVARNVAIYTAMEGSPFRTAGVEAAFEKFTSVANARA